MRQQQITITKQLASGKFNLHLTAPKSASFDLEGFSPDDPDVSVTEVLKQTEGITYISEELALGLEAFANSVNNSFMERNRKLAEFEEKLKTKPYEVNIAPSEHRNRIEIETLSKIQCAFNTLFVNTNWRKAGEPK